MNTNLEYIEEMFQSFFQKNVEIVLKNKVLKEGKLILFTIRDFYLVFKLQVPNSQRMVLYELPYPFSVVSVGDSEFRLSYILKEYIKNDKALELLSLTRSQKHNQKIYNSEVIVRIKSA